MNRLLMLYIWLLLCLGAAPLQSQYTPTEVTGRLLNDSQLELSFTDINNDEHGFLVYTDGIAALWKPLVHLPPAPDGRASHVIGFPPFSRSRRFMVRAYGAWGYSSPSERIEFVHPDRRRGSECEDLPAGHGTILCLDEKGRFVMWASLLHRTWGRWRAINWKQFSPGEPTGFGWVFSEDNIELTVKVLDGCSHNGSKWLFAAATTDLLVHMNLLDRETGLFKSWYIDAGESDSEELVHRWLRLYPTGESVRGKVWYRVTQGYGVQDLNAARACED
ncbi:MAG: hypothetical protein OYL92_10935 [Acidobacteriota bacterium]|nr:hypothetical protein [Acidobacteriota bacterium]MDE3265471.1 hypothetical protein [Acidobacteriota bacterium]